jgi:RNA polymerase sigma-70 factor (ECF subfamily)
MPEHASALVMIAKGLAKRDTSALGALYDLMGRRAFGLAYTVTGDAALSEDAVQDAFLALWKQAESVSAHKGRVDSLLLTLVHRRAVDHVRKRARRQRAEGAQPVELSNGRHEDPEEIAIRLSEQAIAVQGIRGLPEDQRRVIELAYFRGMTQREIADATGVSLGTVKGRLRLGLDKLRTAFGLEEGHR